MTSGRYHPGERTAQALAGVVERAERAGGLIGATVPPVAADYLAKQPMVVVAAADEAGQMWASLLTGPSGFAVADGDRAIVISAMPLPGDPLEKALSRPTKVGTIALEPDSHRRMRVNGRAHPVPGGLRIEADQVFSNCGKYIQTRTAQRRAVLAPPPQTMASPALTQAQQRAVAGADTFFIATRSADGDADASHRGGNPGFVQVVSPTALRWPDYVGNAMMMTLGNLEQDPSAGLLLLDWDAGTTLQLTGTARVDWQPASSDRLPGSERVINFELTRVVQTDHASPLTWSAPGYSRFNPSLGPTRQDG